MITVTAKVFEHHQKEDGTWNVKICVYHQGVRRYVETTHFVSKKQLDVRFKIKDKFLLNRIEKMLEEYHEAISHLGNKVNFFTCDDLVNYLKEKDTEIDFIKFCSEHIDWLKREKRTSSANPHRTVRNSLIDYFGRNSVSITEIHSNMLYSYERYLRGERTMKRINQLGKEVVTVEKGLSDAGLHNHMRDLRTLFNAACLRYNNEDLGLYKIKHYPFKRYKIGSAPLTRKRNNTIDEILKIRDCSTPLGSRVEMAKELYMLSFYLCGMNAVDIYHTKTQNIHNGRIDYNRAKTKGRRKDRAFISIRIVEEAQPLIDKYLDILPSKYTSHEGLDSALSKGMKDLRKLTGIPDITFYWARHSFASLARNSCRMSKDDVAVALNHVDEGHRTTDIYIAKDWKIVDEVQEKVVGLLRNSDKNSDELEPEIRKLRFA